MTTAAQFVLGLIISLHHGHHFGRRHEAAAHHILTAAAMMNGIPTHD